MKGLLVIRGTIVTFHPTITLNPLSHHDWLVVIDDGQSSDGHRLAGMIALHQGMYETTSMSEPLTREFHGSLASAVSFFSAVQVLARLRPVRESTRPRSVAKSPLEKTARTQRTIFAVAS